MKKNVLYSCKCDGCENIITGRKAYDIIQHKKSGQTKKAYCSKECKEASRPVKKEIVSCAQCNKKIQIYKRFITGRNFCSHSCSATFINKEIAAPKRYCSDCNKVLCGNDERCRKCGIKNYRKQYIIRWKAGLEPGHDSFYGIIKIVRAYILEKFGNKCCKCGWAEVHPTTKRVPLEIDHIDGNHKNSSEDNLRPLCPNCHVLTTTYGPLNKGKGREHKREYNKEYKQKNKLKK